MYADVVLVGFLPQSQLSHHLIGEAVAHHERRMAGGTTKVDQSTFGQNDDRFAVRIDILVNRTTFVGRCLDSDCFDVRAINQVGNLNFAVKVADVADDRLMLHLIHVFATNDVLVTGRGHKDVADGSSFGHVGDLKAFHRGLQSTDRINLGNDHSSTQTVHGGGTAFANVAITTDDDDFAGHHHVGSSLDAVSQ